MINEVNAFVGTGSPNSLQPGRQMDELGSADFMRLLTVQVQNQDPFEPVDNTQMLAQMAQFSSLAGTAETNETLAKIVEKLDQMIAATEAQSGEPADTEGKTGE